MGKDLTFIFQNFVDNYKLAHPEYSSLIREAVTNQFSPDAEELVKCLTQLKTYISHSKAKFKDKNYIKNFLSQNSEKETDEFVNQVLDSLFQKLNLLKLNYLKNNKTQQDKHREIVCDSILGNIKGTCQSYVQLQTSKANIVMEHMDIKKLHTPSMKISRVFENSSFQYQDKIKSSPDFKEEVSKSDDIGPTLHINQEEIQQFESENRQLYEEYTSSLNELQSIEHKVSEIARMQSVLTENLLSQEENVDRVANSTINTTENIKLGNTEIIKALQHKAGTRVWVLFILIVLTFSLLFLDWYNP